MAQKSAEAGLLLRRSTCGIAVLAAGGLTESHVGDPERAEVMHDGTRRSSTDDPRPRVWVHSWQDGREIFFHHSSLPRGVFDSLGDGQEFEYEIEMDAHGRGERARDVRLVDS